MKAENRLTERASHIDRVDELILLLESSAWFRRVAAIAADVDPPEWWISAGVIRDLVWGERFAGRFDPANTKDVDLAFFDANDLAPERDSAVEQDLRSYDNSVPWDAKSQAAVHRWYPERFAVVVAPFRSAEEAVATFPEFATCVAVRRTADGVWDVAAPYGLHDLIDGVWRRNPERVTVAEYQSRLARKQPQLLWPSVSVEV